MQKISISIMVFCLITVALHVALGAPATIHFKSSTIEPKDYKSLQLIDHSEEKAYRLQLEGDHSLLKAWISPTISASRSTKALGLSVFDYDGCLTKQRAELEIANTVLEKNLYYGFSVYIHPQSKPLVKKTIFTQVWQSHDTQNGNAKYPPFSLLFEDSAYRWTLETSNDEKPSPGNKSVVYTSPSGLKKGRWYRFVIRFKPSIQSKGAVSVWLDGKLIVSQTNRRNFGYTPASDPIVNPSLVARIGAYRGRQPCGSDGPEQTLGTIHLFFDRVITGQSFDEVK